MAYLFATRLLDPHMRRFCDCGCTSCRTQTAQHVSCMFECETDVTEVVPRHGREIITIPNPQEKTS